MPGGDSLLGFSIIILNLTCIVKVKFDISPIFFAATQIFKYSTFKYSKIQIFHKSYIKVVIEFVNVFVKF